MSKAQQAHVPPVPAAVEYVYGGGRRTRVSALTAALALLVLVASAALFAHQAHLLPGLVSGQHASAALGTFDRGIRTHSDLCAGGEQAPKRPFFWTFDAQGDTPVMCADEAAMPKSTTN